MALYSGGGSPSAVRTSPVIKVVVERESVFLGGSYCKYSRHVSAPRLCAAAAGLC